MPPKPKLLAALLIACLLTGCATATGVTDTSCTSFKPIRGSVKDTPDTKRQIVAHNGVYDAICKP